MKKLLQFTFLIVVIAAIFSCENANNAVQNEEKETINKAENTTEIKEEQESESTTETSSIEPEKSYTSAAGKTIPFYKYNAFKNAYLNTDDETTYVVNFWATWCGPCVKELPFFFEAEKAYADKPVKFIYASLDFKRKIEKKLLPFVDEKDMNAVVVIDQKEANDWIKEVDESWDGAIPATLIINKKGSKFYRQSFESAKEIQDIINANQ